MVVTRDALIIGVQVIQVVALAAGFGWIRHEFGGVKTYLAQAFDGGAPGSDLGPLRPLLQESLVGCIDATNQLHVGEVALECSESAATLDDGSANCGCLSRIKAFMGATALQVLILVLHCDGLVVRCVASSDSIGGSMRLKLW